MVALHYAFSSSTSDPFSAPPKEGQQPQLAHTWRPNFIDEFVHEICRAFGIIFFRLFHNRRWYIWLAERARWEPALTKVDFYYLPGQENSKLT